MFLGEGLIRKRRMGESIYFVMPKWDFNVLMEVIKRLIRRKILKDNNAKTSVLWNILQ